MALFQTTQQTQLTNQSVLDMKHKELVDEIQQLKQKDHMLQSN